MKEKGFTLVELLAVIVILAIIALIVAPNIVGNVNKYKDSLNDTQIKSIKSAAAVWGSDNMYILPDSATSTNTCYYSNINNCPESYRTLIVDLETLQNGGYIGNDIKDINTKETIDNLEISITKTGSNFVYEIVSES